MIGEMHADSFAKDPKHLGFVLARYKFVAKMLTGFNRVLEVGCGDCTGAPVVASVVNEWQGLDNYTNGFPRPSLNLNVHFFDIAKGPFGCNEWDAVYMLDVLEHIRPADEDGVFENIKVGMTARAPLIVGTPSKESQPYASELSKLYHVNCQTEDELRETMKRHFYNCFVFGMNDEVLHTGFGPMCHYRLAIACGKR